MAAPPLDSPCDGPVTYPGDIKTLRIPSKEEADLLGSHSTNKALKCLSVPYRHTHIYV